jgi:hypothetical protein
LSLVTVAARTTTAIASYLTIDANSQGKVKAPAALRQSCCL